MTEDSYVKIIVAIIGLLGGIITLLSSLVIKMRKQAVEDAKRDQKHQDSFERLFDELIGVKKRLDCHNGYAKKFEENSKELSKINNKLTGIEKDIEYLKTDRCVVKKG